MCRAYLYNTAKLMDSEGGNNMDCASVIYKLSKTAVQICLEGIQCLGGNGYINDFITGQLLRDAKLYEIGAGTNEIR